MTIKLVFYQFLIGMEERAANRQFLTNQKMGGRFGKEKINKSRKGVKKKIIDGRLSRFASHHSCSTRGQKYTKLSENRI